MGLTQDIFGITDSQPGGHDPTVDSEAIFWGMQKFISETEHLFKSVYRLSDWEDKLQELFPWLMNVWKQTMARSWDRTEEMVFLSSLNTAQQSRPVRGPLPGKANILCNQGFPSKGQKLFPVLHWPASVGRARCVQARQHASFKRWQTCAVLQQNIYNSLS